MRFMIALVVLFSSLAANAEIVFSPSVSYLSQKDENSGTVSEEKIGTYDFKLGYLHQSGLYLGGMYSMMKVNDDSGSSLAATVGYHHFSGFFALFSYHLMAEMDAGANKIKNGVGPQIDLGWVFPLTSMFSVGPQITYRSINYKKADTGGVTSDIDFTRSNLMPYITLWFRF
jgi:hypothetical protein